MAATDPMTSEPRRYSIEMPRPLWIGVATIVLIVASVGLRIGIPIYRQELAIQKLTDYGRWVAALEGTSPDEP
jgi:hypothetical protein